MWNGPRQSSQTCAIAAQECPHATDSIVKVVQQEQIEGLWSSLALRPLWSAVRVLFGEPILTIDRTIFEMWLGSL